MIMIKKYRTVSGIGTIIQGECSTIKEYGLVLHGVINALLTPLLEASNHCM